MGPSPSRTTSPPTGGPPRAVTRPRSSGSSGGYGGTQLPIWVLCRSTPSARKSCGTGRSGWRRTSVRLRSVWSGRRSPASSRLRSRTVASDAIHAGPARSGLRPRPPAGSRRGRPNGSWRVREALPDRYRLLLVIGAGLGLRQGEALGLSADDIDFEKEAVHVRRQIKMVRAKLCGDGTRAEGHQPELLQLLRVEARSGHGGCDRLAGRGQYRRCSRVGAVPGTRLPCPTHGYASEELEAAGESIVSLARRLGHSDPGSRCGSTLTSFPAPAQGAAPPSTRSSRSRRPAEPVERGP